MAEPSKRVRLGDFIIEKKVGEGGMGTVFMARQESLDRVVALKVLPRSFAENPEFVERFRREARAAASLVHPNVVQVYSVGEEKGVPYFAMEFVDGKSLDELVKSGKRFAVREAAGLAVQVARALEAAYEKGLVHRDIKPANVMLDRKNTVKVTDFGLAKPSSGSLDITQPGLVVGTPIYMSPEQGAGEDVDCTSDIYSLGVVLYEMLTGRVPFQSENVGTIIYKHLHEPPAALNAEVPGPLEGIVLRCLGKRPQDRYASPGELVRALNAFLRGEPQTDPTLMLRAGAAAPQPDDATLRVPTPVPVGGPPSGKRGVAPPLSTPATTLQPVPAKKGSGMLIGFTAALVLMAAGGGGYYLYHVRTRPVKPADNGSTRPPANGNGVTPGEQRLALSLAPLGELLPGGSRVELITPEGPVAVSLANPQELELPAGSYQLNFSRPGYESRSWKLTLSAEGVSPELDEESISLEPTAELLGPYQKGEKLLAGERVKYSAAAAALRELKKAAEIDPDFRKVAELLKRAGESMSLAEQRWQDQFTRAKGLAGQKKWREAKTAFEKLLKEIPPGKPLYNSVQMQVTTASDALMKVVRYRDQITGGIRKGEYDKAWTAHKQLVLISPASPELGGLAATIEKGAKLLKKANADYAAGDYAGAGKGFDRVLAVSPECVAARKLKARCAKLLKTTNEIERAVAAAEGQLEAGNYAACLAALDKLAGRSLGEHAKRVAALRARAAQGAEAKSIDAQLARFGRAFAGADLDTLRKQVFDFRPAHDDFRRSFEAQARELAASGIEITAWEHKLGSVKVERSARGEPSTARARAACSFKLSIPAIGKTVSGSMPVEFTFNQVGGKWLLAAAAPGGRPKVTSGGAGPAAPRLSGKVAAVEGRIVTIDRGKAQGVTAGMVFNVFEPARVVHLPMTKEKLFVEERPLAAVEVFDVGGKSARCAFVPGTAAEAIRKVKAGMLVSLSRARKVARTFPVVAGIKASAAAAAAGERVAVTLEVKAVKGVFVSYKWSATGGILSSRRTASPGVKWTAPAKAGDYQITATVAAPSGRQEVHSLTVKSSGTGKAHPKSYVLEARLGRPGILEDCRDIAFDAQGYAYVLDGRLRRVLLFDPDCRLRGPSGKYTTAATFERIAVRDDVLYCLDTRSGSVKRYYVGRAVQFAKEHGKGIGGRGEGNGKLRAPVDLAFSAAGELHVLDAPEGAPSVQVFGAGGNFIQSFGSRSRGAGSFSQPVAIVGDRAGRMHVLDAGRRRVVSFKDGRPLGTFACGPKTAQLVDLAYDAATDSLIVLDAAGGTAGVYSPAGKARGSLGAKAGLTSLKGATRIAAGRAGSALAAAGAGKLLSRFATDGTFLGQAGGTPFSGYCKIAAGPGEGLSALDTSTGVVRSFDRNGWMLAEFGGRKAFRKAADLVVDDNGLVYVLDSGASDVKVFDAAGRPKGTYGKRGRPPAGLEGVIDLATDGGKRLGVLCYQPQNSIFHYGLGMRSRPVVFPSRKRSTQGPKLLAIDSATQTFLLDRKGQVTSYDQKQNRLGTWPIAFRDARDMEARAGRVFVLDAKIGAALVCDAGGAELARIKLPKDCRKPDDLAASDYEVVYIFDVGLRSVLKFRAKR